MAYQETNVQSNQAQEFIELLLRRRWQILVPTAFFLAIGIAWSEFVPRKYDVRTVIELRQMQLPWMGQNDPQVITRDIKNAKVQLTSKNRIASVIADLQWDDFLSLTSKQLRTEYIARIQSEIKVSLLGGGKDSPSSFVTIKFADTNPERAEQFLNRLRDVFIEDVVERFRNQAREERDKLQDIVHEKELEYQNSERELAELKRNNDLSYTQPAPFRGQTREEEPVFRELTKRQSELSQVLHDLEINEATIADLEARFRDEPDRRQQVQREAGKSQREAIAEIDQQILAKKAEQDGIKPAHSRWQKAQSEIESLEEQRAALEQQSVAGVTEITFIGNEERDRIRTALNDAQITQVRLQAKAEYLRSEIESLQVRRDANIDAQRRVNELDNLVEQNRLAYNAAFQRYQSQRTFVELISGPEGNPFEVMEEAEAPRLPTSPSPWLIRIIGLILGLGFGISITLLGEFASTSFRTATDVARAMGVPVLGAVNDIVTQRDRRRQAFQRLAIGFSSAALIAMILWITWAWKQAPNLLDPTIVDAIEELRSQFR